MRKPSDGAVVVEIAEAIHRFVQRFPNHYASRALAGLVSRRALGETVTVEEHDLVLATLVRAIKEQPPERRRP